jgi:hypothetical protein
MGCSKFYNSTWRSNFICKMPIMNILIASVLMGVLSNSLGAHASPDSNSDSASILTLTVTAPNATSVSVVGPLWDSWFPDAGPVATDNSDGTWSVFFDPAPDANMEYLWLLDGVQEDLVTPAAVGECTAEIDAGTLNTDYVFWGIRSWLVGSGDKFETAGACAGISAEPEPIPAGVADFSEAFGGTSIGEDSVFSFPVGAESWGGFANMNTDLYPISISEAGTLTFNASLPSGGSSEVYFQFQKNSHPDVEPSYNTGHVTVSGSDVVAYSIDLTSQGANTFRSFLLYVVDRDVGVQITDVTLYVDEKIGVLGPVDSDNDGVNDDEDAFPNDPYKTTESGYIPEEIHPSPTPTDAADSVLSLFSDAYTDQEGTNFNPDWGQATQVTVSDVLTYAGLTYQGTNIASSDVSGYAYIRLDAYTADATDLQFTIISPGAENLISLADQLVLDQWVTVEIALTDFVADLTAVNQLKVVGNGTILLDNIYFGGVASAPEPEETTTYCATEVTHFNIDDHPGSILLTVENSGADSMTVTAASNEDKLLDAIIVDAIQGGGTATAVSITNGVATAEITWTDGTMPATTSFNMLWSDDTQTGLYMVDTGDADNGLGNIDTSNVCPDAIQFSEAFGGAAIDGSLYTFPSSADSWAGFTTTSILNSIKFYEEGTISFSAYVPSDGTVDVRFRFERDQWPNSEPSFETESVTVSGAETVNYIVNIPPLGSLEFSSLIMYLNSRDEPVSISDVVVNGSTLNATDLDTVAPMIALPVDFEEAGSAYEIAGFDGGVASVEAGPDGAVSLKYVKGAGENWAGVWINLDTAVDSSNGEIFTADVHSTVARDITLRFIDANVERVASHGGTGWESLFFDFTGAMPAGQTKIAFFNDLTQQGDGTDAWTIYIDNLVKLNVGDTGSEYGDTGSEYGDTGSEYGDTGLPLMFGGNYDDYAFGHVGSTFVTDIIYDYVNDTSGLQYTKYSGLETSGIWVSVAEPIDFSLGYRFYSRIYSTVSREINFGFSNSGISRSAEHFGEGWQTLEFDFSGEIFDDNQTKITIINEPTMQGDGSDDWTIYIEGIAQESYFNWDYYSHDFSVYQDDDVMPLFGGETNLLEAISCEGYTDPCYSNSWGTGSSLFLGNYDEYREHVLQLSESIDISEYDFLRLDFYFEAMRSASIFLIDSNNNEKGYKLNFKDAHMMGFEIPLSMFNGIDLSAVNRIKVISEGWGYLEFNNWYFVSNHSVFSGITNTPVGDTGNLVTDGTFDEAASSIWSGNAYSPVDGVNQADVAAAGNPWDVNLSGTVDLTAGATYTLSFDVSGGDRTLIAGIGQSSAPWFNNTKTVTLSAASQTMVLHLTAKADGVGEDFGDATSRVIFDMGADTGAVNIDNVSLTAGHTGTVNLGTAGDIGPNIPLLVDFEEASNTYEIAGFDGGEATIEAGPDGANSLKYVKGAGQNWAGVWINLDTAVDAANGEIITADIYSTVARDITLMLELDPIEREASHGGTGWESLSFDFTGTMPANQTKIGFYNDLTQQGDGSDAWTIYIDNLAQPTEALGPMQVVTVAGDPRAVVGQTMSIVINYDVTDGNSSLTGLGLNIHYNSTQVTFEKFSNIFSTDIISYTGTFSDDEDLDGDSSTDKYVFVAWASLFGNWPGTLPKSLSTIDFMVEEAAAGEDSVRIGFSTTSNAIGYSFQGDSTDINIIGANWDFDGNGSADALTDGLLLVRYAFGLRGSKLLGDNVVSDDSSLTAQEIEANIVDAQEIADIDGNDSVGALSDGLLLLRHLFDITGNDLIKGVVHPNGSRQTAEEITAYMNGFMPAAE